MSVVERLTEGIRERSLANEGEALLDKWDRTGLLEGLGDIQRSNMARLLENQAAQLLKETSTMAAGDVEGFASVAFPLVRRVFGNLLAQDVVSVQPMSLPSGLIFFLDFVYSSDGGMNAGHRLGAMAGTSIYGKGRVGAGITGGVDLGPLNQIDFPKDGGQLGDETSFYSLNNGYSSPTGSALNLQLTAKESGTFGESDYGNRNNVISVLRDDPAFISGSTTYVILEEPTTSFSNLNEDNLVAITVGTGSVQVNGRSVPQIRRLTQFSGSSRDNILFVFAAPTGSVNVADLKAATNGANLAALAGGISWPVKDVFQAGNALGSIRGGPTWNLENQSAIPEIDIKVDSVAVTALTKKLKAKWTPELAQDLNAYHNLDAEVELTSVLSEHIALEIDQEILEDLIKGQTGGMLHWSRQPGRFLNRENGEDVTTSLYPDFTGTVSEWYETLLETINDLSARIHRKTLRGGANFVITSPEVASVMEFTAGFRADAVVDEEKGSWGAVKVGSLSRKMDVFVDPYFPRNLLLVGRRGTSFLESGYVYAPYVPLQVTPTIFGTEDFVPRKGVMTRYAKKMVRPDMYGLVVCHDLV
tara:strand:+ start:892 stop:2652 length:1761 start_codon:yes stop_codon:yes gene_type:complete